MPVAVNGAIRFGEHIREDVALSAPTSHDGVLCIHRQSTPSGMRGPQLRPIRALVTEHIGIRFQGGPRLAWAVWSQRAIIVNAQGVLMGLCTWSCVWPASLLGSTCGRAARTRLVSNLVSNSHPLKAAILRLPGYSAAYTSCGSRLWGTESARFNRDNFVLCRRC